MTLLDVDSGISHRTKKFFVWKGIDSGEGDPENWNGDIW